MSASGGSRRAWGWHPLTAEWAQRLVLEAGVAPGALVLDLGAGEGALTAPLLRAGARVIAVQLHHGRATALRRRFATALDDGRLRVVRADLRELRLPRRPFQVVASPPYAAGTDALRLLLGSDLLTCAHLVLQRSAARRLAQQPPRARHARRYRLDVLSALPRSAFRPPPRVDSVVLRVRRR